MRLSSKELSKLSGAIAALYAPSRPSDLPTVFIRTVRTLLDCDHLCYNEFGPRHFCGVLDPVISDDLNRVFASLSHQHPSIAYVKTNRVLDAVKISDFITPAHWKRSELFNEFFRKLGIDHQLALMFPASSSIEIGFAANRAKRDFTEEERQLLTLLQPHFLQAYENARALERTSRAADVSGGGTAIFTDSGTLLFCSPKARRAIGRFFGPVSGGKLPAELHAWARRAMRSGPADGLASGSLHPLTREGEKSSLTVRLSPNFLSNEHVLTFEEQAKDFPISVFTRFGHSRREAEVLSWIAQGKTNPEIAIILDISTRTVAHHVEKILAKIGVEGRGSAGVWAQEKLRDRQMTPSFPDGEET